MRIVLWSSNYFPCIGGLERLVHDLAVGLKGSGHSVMVVTDASQKSQIVRENFEGIPILRLPFTTAIGNKNLSSIKSILQTLDRVLIEFKPDVVNVHGWYETLAFFQTRVAAKTTASFFLTIHGLFEQKSYNTQACQLLWNRCQSVNTVSNALAGSLEDCGLSHVDIRIIQNASQASSIPFTLPLLPVRKLLCVGRLSPEKRFDLAIEALHVLLPRYPDLHLTVVGGGQLYSELVELRDKLGLQSNINFVDYVLPDKVNQFIDECSLILVPSDYESFGLVALEAAWRARPVIASSVLGLCEIVSHNETGLLISPGSAECLADAIDSLIQAPNLVHRMAKAANLRAKNYFNLPGMVARYELMYQGKQDLRNV